MPDVFFFSCLAWRSLLSRGLHIPRPEVYRPRRQVCPAALAAGKVETPRSTPEPTAAPSSRARRVVDAGSDAPHPDARGSRTGNDARSTPCGTEGGRNHHQSREASQRKSATWNRVDMMKKACTRTIQATLKSARWGTIRRGAPPAAPSRRWGRPGKRPVR
uniref:Uncharacterized protein n=1 Tax=Ixodes ricinus TaxID=34613 RepID=A0A6B0UXL2_IXORI